MTIFLNIIEEILQSGFIFNEVGMLANVINKCNLIVSILSVVLTISCNNVSNSIAQRVIIKFLFNEAEILHKQFEEECLSLRTVFEWCKSFQDGCERVSNLPHTARSASAVNLGNIHKVDQLIWSNRRISVKEISGNVNTGVGSVHTIVYGKKTWSLKQGHYSPTSPFPVAPSDTSSA